MKKLAFALAAGAGLAIAAMSSAFAGATLQGPQLTGVVVRSLLAGKPAIVAVRLPSSNAVDLSQPNGSRAAGHR
jgi:hypothetical protein